MARTVRYTLPLALGIICIGATAAADCWKEGPWFNCTSPPTPRVCVNQNGGGVFDCGDTQTPALGCAIRFAVGAGVDEPGQINTLPKFYCIINRTIRACPTDVGSTTCTVVTTVSINCSGTFPSGPPCVGVIGED